MYFLYSVCIYFIFLVLGNDFFLYDLKSVQLLPPSGIDFWPSTVYVHKCIYFIYTYGGVVNTAYISWASLPLYFPKTTFDVDSEIEF